MTSQSKIEKQHYWFIFQEDQLLLQKIGDAVSLPTSASVEALTSAFIRQYQLIELDHSIIHCAELTPGTTIPDQIQATPLRKALILLGQDWFNVAAKAYSIINWDKNHQFCGRCGQTTTLKLGSFERVCSTCSLVFYPRISPSMIVLIRKGDHILMARSHHFTPGAYGLIAGFVEAGESVEDAVHREVAEEVGIKIKNLHYFGSQSWPFPDSLMIAFHADYASGELTINHEEIEDAGWYRFDQLPGRPSTSLSISSKLLDHCIAELKQG